MNLSDNQKPYWNAYPKERSIGKKKEKPTKEVKETKGYKPKIKAVSKKRAVEQREYSHLAKQFKIDNPVCQIPVEGCTRIATELHHAAGRCGSLLTDVAYFKSACHNCHTWTTNHPKESIEKGYSFLRIPKKTVMKDFTEAEHHLKNYFAVNSHGAAKDPEQYRETSWKNRWQVAF